MSKKMKVPRTKPELILLIIEIIKQIFVLAEKYGPDIAKLLKKLFAFLLKSGAKGIKGLKQYLAEEEKKWSAASKKKVVKKRKKPKKTKTSVKHKATKTKKSKR